MMTYELLFADSFLILWFADAIYGNLCPHFLNYIFHDINLYLYGSDFFYEFYGIFPPEELCICFFQVPQ